MRAIGCNYVSVGATHTQTSRRLREILFSLNRASTGNVGFESARASLWRSKRRYGPR